MKITARSFLLPGIPLILILLLICFLISPNPSYASEKTVLFLFWMDGCPHCTREKVFLKTMEKKYPELEIRDFEIRHSEDNSRKFIRVSRAYGIDYPGTPTTIIGDFDPIVGYHSDETTGKVIEQRIIYCIKNSCSIPEKIVWERVVAPPDLTAEEIAKYFDPVTLLLQLYNMRISSARTEFNENTHQEGTITLPLLGTFNPSSVESLPIFTMIIAGLDSFNPCAFFVLFALLGMLTHARSKSRMLLIGGIFVFFSGLMYFLFMAAWLNVFMFMGQLVLITVIAGIIALIIGGINIKDFFFFKKGVSLVISDEARPRLIQRIRKLARESSLFASILGTIVLAVAANAYELLCTAGFPMVFTRVLTLHNLSPLEFYSYLAFYNLVYIIPLAIIVIGVTLTLGKINLTEWRGRCLKLVSGLMMFSLGIILLVNPDLLNNLAYTTGLLVLVLGISGAIMLACKPVKSPHQPAHTFS